MSKYKYSKTEQEINNILKYQSNQLEQISFSDTKEIDESIVRSEEILRSLNIDLPKKNQYVKKDLTKKEIPFSTWEELCSQAEAAVGNQCILEDLFTEEELKENEQYISQLNNEYNQLHRLDKNDITICVGAGLLAAIVDILLIGIPQKTPEGMKGGALANYVRDYFDQRFPPDEMEKLANSKVSKVPYDAQDNRNTEINVEGLSSYYHRLLTLGHDPILGFVVGVADIMTGKMTTIDKSGRFVSQTMPNYQDRTEKDIFAAIAKQIIHLKSDVTTSMGLPAPFMGLFNLCQFGSIGEEEQTIAEIVQGMYYEGYDFIHFCSQSITVMIIEVITRIFYVIKNVREGHPIKETISVSSKKNQNYKLRTMLFISHSIATAVNSGKIFFTKNPMAINYPQWMAFAKYTYQQMKWVLFEKPEARDIYVRGVINNQLDEVFKSVEDTFDEFSKDDIIVLS